MKQKMKQIRLQRRIHDFQETLQRPSDHKVQVRKDSGGYHQPGSMKK